MVANFAISNSALQATQIRQDVVSHDVANINTDGFEESRVTQQDDNPGTSIASISKTPNTNPGGYSNTAFEKEATNMIVNRNVYGANADVIRIQDDMIGEVIDLVG